MNKRFDNLFWQSYEYVSLVEFMSISNCNEIPLQLEKNYNSFVVDGDSKTHREFVFCCQQLQ